MDDGCCNGKTKEEVEELATGLSEMVQGQSDPRQEELGDAAFLSGVSKFPQRIKCADPLLGMLLKKRSNVANS